MTQWKSQTHVEKLILNKCVLKNKSKTFIDSTQVFLCFKNHSNPYISTEVILY